ncbi:hypothetical protein D3C79_1106250 [compost metagenome]
MVTSDAIALALIIRISSLPSGPMATSSDCGRITLKKVVERLRLKALAASYWPGATASRLPRKISAW